MTFGGRALFRAALVAEVVMQIVSRIAVAVGAGVVSVAVLACASGGPEAGGCRLTALLSPDAIRDLLHGSKKC